MAFKALPTLDRFPTHKRPLRATWRPPTFGRLFILPLEPPDRSAQLSGWPDWEESGRSADETITEDSAAVGGRALAALPLC